MARENVSFSEIVSVLENTLVAEEGLEQINDLSEASNICAEGSAKSSALSTEMHHMDPQVSRGCWVSTNGSKRKVDAVDCFRNIGLSYW